MHGSTLRRGAAANEVSAIVMDTGVWLVFWSAPRETACTVHHVLTQGASVSSVRLPFPLSAMGERLVSSLAHNVDVVDRLLPDVYPSLHQSSHSPCMPSSFAPSWPRCAYCSLRLDSIHGGNIYDLRSQPVCQLPIQPRTSADDCPRNSIPSSTAWLRLTSEGIRILGFLRSPYCDMLESMLRPALIGVEWCRGIYVCTWHLAVMFLRA